MFPNGKCPFPFYQYYHWQFGNCIMIQTFWDGGTKTCNRPLALRGHVTNASLKQWVVILLLPKLDRTHKNYLTPEIWEETHFREIFYGTLIFNKVAWFVLAAMLEGMLLPSNMAVKTTFCLYLVKCLIVAFRCAINVAISSFQHFPWSVSAKFVSESGNS